MTVSSNVSPVLLLLFNRPDCTKQVFQAVREARPSKLYIAIDGPRTDNASDIVNVTAVRDYVLGNIDWPCTVKTNIRKTNLGCKNAVSSAISWFFEQEEEGIVLEDDCLPNKSFFTFCTVLLDKYRCDNRVRHISGVNFQENDLPGDASYYFSTITHVWGWASWRRVWNAYDKDFLLLDTFLQQKQIENIYPDKKIAKALVNDFKRVQSGLINTWDFQYLFLNLINHGLCIIPRTSLVKNIGFGDGSTHEHFSKPATQKTAEMEVITHPDFVVPQLQLDLKSLAKTYHISLQDKIKFKIAKHTNRHRRQ